MKIQSDCKYAKSHEWIKKDGTGGIVGISDYAHKEISDIVYVDLPEVGKEITAKDSVCIIESVKAAFDIYAPVSGKVVEINNALESDPALVNTDPYEKGWLFKIEFSSENEFDALMDSAAYEQHITSEKH